MDGSRYTFVKVPIAPYTASMVCRTASLDSPRRRPAQRAQAASTCGMACCSAGLSMILRGSQSSRKVSAFAGLIRSGRPKSCSQP